MRIPSGVTDQVIYFVAVDSTDLKTRETGLTTFTVYRDRNGAGAAAMTTPTVTEVDATNMPGLYKLLLDEDMTIGSGNDSEEMAFHITQASMAPVTRTIELYRAKITAGETLTVSSGAVSTVTTNTDLFSAASVADAVWDEDIVAAHGTSDTAGLILSQLTHRALATGWSTDITANSVFDYIADDGTAVYDRTSDSLQAISDGGGVGFTVTDIVNGVWDEGQSGHLSAGTFGLYLDSEVSGATAPTAAAVADAVWDEDIVAAHGTSDTAGLVLSQLTHRALGTGWTTDITANSALDYMADDGTAAYDRTTDSLQAIRDEGSSNWTTGSGTGLTALASGTAQSGTASTIVLTSGATFADNVLNGNVIKVTGGTGAGQARVIISNTLADDTCNVAPNWTTNPSSDSVYEIVDGSVNIEAISLDNTAATNLELQYDTTGLSGDTFPSTQAQIGNLTSGTAAINTTAESFTKSGAEPETNTYTSTVSEDGTLHQVEDVAGATDAYYQFDVGGNGVPVSVTWIGYAQSNGDSYTIWAYNYGTTTYEQIGTIVAGNGTTNSTNTYDLTNAHVGTGANIGKVRFRFLSADGTKFATDRLLCSYAVVAQSVGYALGRIWIDTSGGTAGSESYVNGVADNPTDSLADALTIASNLGLHLFNASRDSTIAPAADFNDFTIYGTGYTFTLGGHDYAGTHIYHASPVTGTATSSGNSDHFDIIDSIIGAVTVDDAHFTRCGFTGTLTMSGVGTGTPGEMKFIDCFSLVAGSTTPIFDFGTGSENHNVTFANWQNGLEIRNFNVTTTGGTDLLSISGTGQLIIASTCDGGTINLRGQWKITDNSGGAVTITQDDIATDVAAILVDTAELGAAVGASLSADIAAVKAETVLIVADTGTDGVKLHATQPTGWAANLVASAGVIVKCTVDTVTNTHTPTTTEFQADDVTEATADHFIGRIVIFTSGVLIDQATDITDYAAVGGIGQFTVTALTEAPSNNDTFVIV